MENVKVNIDGKIRTYSQADVNLRAQEVLSGQWGNGPERMQRLIDAGYDPNEVQAVVNQIMSGKAPTVETLDVSLDVNTEPEVPIVTPTPAQPAPTQEAIVTAPNTGITPPTQTNPNKLVFKHETSNQLADMAREMGFTEDQVKLAVGISRWETGNYGHLAGGYNYGGVTGSGDAGSYGQYANYSSPEVGMRAYLTNLKTNYIDQGLTTPEACARKYLGYEDGGTWTKGVYGCMS